MFNESAFLRIKRWIKCSLLFISYDERDIYRTAYQLKKKFMSECKQKVFFDFDGFHLDATLWQFCHPLACFLFIFIYTLNCDARKWIYFKSQHSKMETNQEIVSYFEAKVSAFSCCVHFGLYWLVRSFSSGKRTSILLF